MSPPPLHTEFLLCTFAARKDCKEKTTERSVVLAVAHPRAFPSSYLVSQSLATFPKLQNMCGPAPMALKE